MDKTSVHGEHHVVSLATYVAVGAALFLLTGLTASGKASLAYALDRRLFDVGRACTVLAGRNMRKGISRDLGFTAEERSENLRRSAEVAKLMNDAGLICIAAFVAPSEDVRMKAVDVVGSDRFLTVHVATPLDACRLRDEEGAYAKADSGEIANFPGISAPYDTPQDASIRSWNYSQLARSSNKRVTAQPKPLIPLRCSTCIQTRSRHDPRDLESSYPRASHIACARHHSTC